MFIYIKSFCEFQLVAKIFSEVVSNELNTLLLKT